MRIAYEDEDNYLTVCVRDAERYILTWDEETYHEALRVLGDWADNPYLSFTWTDAVHTSLQMGYQKRNDDHT